MSKQILVVDDEPDIRDLVREILEDEGYSVIVAENGDAARACVREQSPNLILLDIWMPDVDGITLLKEWTKGDMLKGPVVMMSGHGTVETAVEATRLGAHDFLEKPLSLAKLLRTVERALEAGLEPGIAAGDRARGGARRIHEPQGHSAIMQRLRQQAQRVAQHDTWVLIHGEPGSGKQTLARYLHANSPRREQPFVDLSVGVIAAPNAAVELFGSESDGQVHPGRLEQASAGVLFLDEVGDMDEEVQAQLTGALDTGSFLRVGGSEPVLVDVRVIAASSKDLEAAVQAGRFREDLFYHLNVVPILIPPLRSHREDVPELLAYFVTHFVDNEGLTYRRFDMGAQNFLRNYHWPGNVLELSNLVQRLLILGGDEVIDQAEVEQAIGQVADQSIPDGVAQVPGLSFDQPLRDARESFERAYLEYQLEKHQGNISRMSQEVGMERTHLYRKLRAVGIEIKDRR